MNANYKNKVSKKEAEVSMGSLYDINKQLISNYAKMDDEKIKDKLVLVKDWVSESIDQHYFMLLCHERRDYTLFNAQKTEQGNYTINQLNMITNDLLECLQNRGSLLSMDLQEDNTWEFWIKEPIDNKCYAYYFFPYGAAVLEY